MLLKEGGISINSAGFNKTHENKAFIKKPTTFEVSLTTDSWPASLPTAAFVPEVRSVCSQARAALTQYPVSGNGY